MSPTASTTPPPPPTYHLSNNIKPEERIAAVFANKNIPKITINPSLVHKEPNGYVEQNDELGEIKAAVAVAAESNPTLETKELSPDKQNDELDKIQPAVAVAAESNPPLETKEQNDEKYERDEIKPAVDVAAASNPPLETNEPSPEQHEKIAVAVAAAESKDNVIEENVSNVQIYDNQNSKIIELEKQLNDEKKTRAVEIVQEKQRHVDEIAQEKRTHADAIAQEKQRHADEIAQEKRTHADAITEANQTHAAAIQAKNKELERVEKKAEKNLFDKLEQFRQYANNKKKVVLGKLKSTQNELVSTQNELVSTQNELKTTQENFKKIQGDRKIVSSDEYKNLTIKFKEYVIYILNEIKDDKNTSSIIRVIEKTIRNDTDKKYDINELKIRELETGVLKEYYNNLPNTLSSRERIKLLIIYILSTYECKEQYNNRGVNIVDLEDYGINDGGTLIKNIYVVCKFLNDFVLDIKTHKEVNDTYTYVNELLMSDLQMYYGIPEYFKEKIDKEEPKLSDIEKCKMYALYVLQNINLDK